MNRQFLRELFCECFKNLVDREDLREMRATLPDGWFVATNLNNVLKKTIIKLATDVAGLTFGKDVNVEFKFQK